MHALVAAAVLVLAAPPPAVWAPLHQPERVFAVENTHADLDELTEVVVHRGSFTALHRRGDGWELLNSPDGHAWTATPITGRFASGGAQISLAAHGADLLAFELTPELVMWRSPDGRHWHRTANDSPWPAAAGLRISHNYVEARRIGINLHVIAGITAHADWEALLGVPEHLVTPTVSAGETLRIRVLSGDLEGDYRVRLEAKERAVLLRVVDDDDRVVGEQRLAPIADPANFVELFVACGGFSPMTESWWVGPAGELAEPPPWLASLGDYPMAAEGAEATFGFDRERGLVRLDAAGDWQPAEAPTSLIQHLFVAGGRVLLVGEEPAEGITVWAFEAGDWHRLRVPAIDGVWLAGAVPDRRGALLLYDSLGAGATATAIGRDGWARSYRLDLPEGVRDVAVRGDTAVVVTTGGPADTALWAWRIERPDPLRMTAL